MWREALLVHPSPERLDAYADGRLEGRERRGITSHLARCARCRRTVLATRRLAAQATAAPSNGYDPDAILRGALARRAAGERLTIPAEPVRLPGDRRSPHTIVRVGVSAVLAASLVLLASGSPALRAFMGAPRTSSTLTSGDGCTSTARHVEEGMSFKRMLKVLVVGPVLAVFGGCAEDRSIGAPVVTTFDGTRMKPATLAYEVRTLVDETPTQDARSYTTRVDSVRLDGTLAWVQELHIGPVPVTSSSTIDSVYYDARTMTPMRSAGADRKGGRWVWERRDGLVRLTEAPPWVWALDTTQLGKRNFRRLIERQMREPSPTHRAPGATVGPAPLEMLTPGLPLDATWRGSLDVQPGPLNLAYRSGVGGATNAYSLAVTGTRTVTTPAGTFDAWVLRGTAPRSMGPKNGKAVAVELWVDRRDGWMLRLRTEQLDDDGDPWISETTLQRVTSRP
jgi:hypothetical protein